jgi:hypothetical protein
VLVAKLKQSGPPESASIARDDLAEMKQLLLQIEADLGAAQERTADAKLEK